MRLFNQVCRFSIEFLHTSAVFFLVLIYLSYMKKRWNYILLPKLNFKTQREKCIKCPHAQHLDYRAHAPTTNFFHKLFYYIKQ